MRVRLTREYLRGYIVQHKQLAHWERALHLVVNNLRRQGTLARSRGYRNVLSPYNTIYIRSPAIARYLHAPSALRRTCAPRKSSSANRSQTLEIYYSAGAPSSPAQLSCIDERFQKRRIKQHFGKLSLSRALTHICLGVVHLSYKDSHIFCVN